MQASWGIEIDGGVVCVAAHSQWSSSMYRHLRRFHLERPTHVRNLFKTRQTSRFSSLPGVRFSEGFSGEKYLAHHLSKPKLRDHQGV